MRAGEGCGKSTGNPRWQPAHLAEYLAKASVVAQAIAAGHFYKRPGKWCGYCDYLPVCLGDQQRVNETLVQVAAQP